MGLCRLPRTVCESVGERWRDGSGSLLILGYPVTKMLAHTLARAVDVTDFRQSRNGDGTVPAAAHSLRACRGAMARRRRQFADLGLSGHTEACTHVGEVGRRDRFSTVEKRRWECARGRAQSARVSASDGATRQAVCLPLVSGHSEACTQVCRGWSTGPIFDCRETEWRESSRWIPRRTCVCVCAR